MTAGDILRKSNSHSIIPGKFDYCALIQQVWDEATIPLQLNHVQCSANCCGLHGYLYVCVYMYVCVLLPLSWFDVAAETLGMFLMVCIVRIVGGELLGSLNPAGVNMVRLSQSC